MDAIQAILTRRSIRRYTSEPVSEQDASITATNLLLPAHAIGLGHPAEEKPDVSDQRYEPEKIHHEKW